MNTASHPLTVKWLLLSFKGRIGRKSFLLAALLLLLVQIALFGYLFSHFEENIHGNYVLPADGGGAFLAIILMLISWPATIWCLLALAVKRLHDLSLPVALGILLIVPGIAPLAWLILATLPSKQETNEHGPVPFPKD